MKQIRYYSNNNSNNYPEELTLELLHNGSIFINDYPIIDLNISGISGIKFYINGNSIPCIIDNTQNFVLKNIEINSLLFDENSLNKIAMNEGYLVISYK